MSYPILVTQKSLDHKGGTKSYHFTLIENNTGQCVLVFRYGKKGQFGQVIVNKYNTKAEAEFAWGAKEREKSGSAGGYVTAGTRSVRTATTSSELSKMVGLGLFNKIGATSIKHIDPSFNVSGMREADEATVDENGRSTGDTSRKADISAELERQRQLDAEAEAAAYANNDNFGIF